MTPVERDQTGTVAPNLATVDLGAVRRAAADHRDQQISFDHRGGADAEEVLDHAELGGGIDLPQKLAVADAVTAQPTLDAIDVDPVAVDHRAGARAVGVNPQPSIRVWLSAAQPVANRSPIPCIF